MDKELIRKKMDEATKKFDKLVLERDAINNELLKLQGEYRSLESLLETEEPELPKPGEIIKPDDPALTIKAEENTSESK